LEFQVACPLFVKADRSSLPGRRVPWCPRARSTGRGRCGGRRVDLRRHGQSNRVRCVSLGIHAHALACACLRKRRKNRVFHAVHVCVCVCVCVCASGAGQPLQRRRRWHGHLLLLVLVRTPRERSIRCHCMCWCSSAVFELLSRAMEECQLCPTLQIRSHVSRFHCTLAVPAPMDHLAHPSLALPLVPRLTDVCALFTLHVRLRRGYLPDQEYEPRWARQDISQVS
jgi:hypothetical protein